MKKVMLLVLTVMLISAFLMASGPRLKIVTLTVINKSGNEILMKLEGSDLGKQFYYLTIPAGDKEWPTVKVFTVLEDVYQRTTWYGEGDNVGCTGLESSGVLVMDRANRLVFTYCYGPPMRDDPVAGRAINAGEPSMEKVQYSEYILLKYTTGKGGFGWGGDPDGGELRSGQLWVSWKSDESEVPSGVQWRYGY